MSKFFRNNKVDLKPKEVPPRALDVIEKEYVSACAQLGQATAKLKDLEREIEEKSLLVTSLNNEGFKRRELDKAAAGAQNG